MKEGPDIAPIAALIGDPARANILTALMAGKALTATELAQEGGVTLQTASVHLSKLEQGGLIRARKQGRHKYFVLASAHVADLLESLMGFAADNGHLRTRRGPRDSALRAARICYNHLAGEAGIQLYESLVRRGYLGIDATGLNLTGEGHRFICEFGISIESLMQKRTPLCRQCLDWSERRSHLAGRLGRSLLDRMREMNWLHVAKGSRVVIFTESGKRAFSRQFPLL
jgi:DNA-binding transcriptional ArsR family regulator